MIVRFAVLMKGNHIRLMLLPFCHMRVVLVDAGADVSRFPSHDLGLYSSATLLPVAGACSWLRGMGRRFNFQA